MKNLSTQPHFLDFSKTNCDCYLCQHHLQNFLFVILFVSIKTDDNELQTNHKWGVYTQNRDRRKGPPLLQRVCGRKRNSSASTGLLLYGWTTLKKKKERKSVLVPLLVFSFFRHFVSMVYRGHREYHLYSISVSRLLSLFDACVGFTSKNPSTLLCFISILFSTKRLSFVFPFHQSYRYIQCFSFVLFLVSL